MAEFLVPSPEAFEDITRGSAAERAGQILAVSARYDRRSPLVMIALNTGAMVGFPLSVMPGLEGASADDLRKIEIEGGGYGLRVASLDADISVPRLPEDQLGAGTRPAAA
jgi:hypothetical protein